MINRNKENDSLYRQRWVKVMKNKTNCENNVELLLLETWNLLDGYMEKEQSLSWTLKHGFKHSECMSFN
jgi:hypothetical protein